MTQKFTIFKSKGKLKEQWNFLEERATGNYSIPLKKSIQITGVISLLYLLLLLLSPVDDYIVTKSVWAVVLTLFWACILILSLVTVLAKKKYRKFVNSYTESITPDRLNYQVEINEERIKLISGITFQEYSWQDVKAYGLHNDTVYIFNTAIPLESIFWSKDEIGDNNFSFLLDILKKKSIKRHF